MGVGLVRLYFSSSPLALALSSLIFGMHNSILGHCISNSSRIIVGVKYCFRYNQRNRQRMQGEDPDAVDLGAVPRQHRRRREKKLMTMEEVNEKFPLTKYKTWRSTRAEEGLPTAGGINAAASRPASIRDVARESKEIEPKSPSIAQTTTAATEDEKAAPEHGKPEEIKEASSSDATPADIRPKTAQSQTTPVQPPLTPIKTSTTNEEGEEDDDHIQTAVPAEQLPDPGDACAICIDTIEDDDDVRGLHCGHAFHASCVDPWLTSRRACCPLCKADYYVPKPRPEGAEAEEARRRLRQSDMPATPQFAFMGAGRRPTMVLPGRFMSIVYDERDRYGFPRVVREPRPPRPSRAERRQSALDERARQRQMSAATTVNAESETGQQPPQAQQTGWRSRLASRIPNPLSLRGDRTNDGPQATLFGPGREDQRTPAQVEAGRT